MRMSQPAGSVAHCLRLPPPQGDSFSPSQEHCLGSIPGMTESLPSMQHQTDCAADSCRQDWLRCVPGDPGRAGLLLKARISEKALAQGSGAGAGAGPGQPAQTLLNNLIRGGLASSLPLPTLDAVFSGCVELSGWLNGLGLGASPATSVSEMSCKVCSLTPALPSLGQSPREVRRD